MNFWKAARKTVKFVGKMAIIEAVGASIAAIDGMIIALLIGTILYVSGKIVKKMAIKSNNNFFEEVGDLIKDVGFGSLISKLLGLITQAEFNQTKTKEDFFEIWFKLV
ncbi:hypothetical protein [endosymbiont GvMRE of Glomus versiforme]|uniref:hypothetical protein n=1 Tax=endosymbiont GvMRE of Glomus versiforme TaxID=2039283 RepID=UPI000ED58906|nr:hypothetical protein [endosymbiont GvMRE of Glomus versiforme]RHZ35574.1 hypothetical protein GvMRE_IIg515 [endosymbiont GvMRE of Glomus versiforme]